MDARKLAEFVGVALVLLFSGTAIAGKVEAVGRALSVGSSRMATATAMRRF